MQASPSIGRIYGPDGKLLPTRITTGEAWIKLGGTGPSFPFAGSGGVFQRNPWVFSAITHPARAFAQIGLGLWQKAEDAPGRRPGFVEVSEDPMLELWAKPNPWQDGFRFLMTWHVYLVTGGNVWVWVDELDERGVPRGLYLFNRNQVRLIRDPATGTPTGWSLTVSRGRRQLTFPFSGSIRDGTKLLHWALPSDVDDVLGTSPLDVLLLTTQADQSRLIYDAAFFENAAEPSSVLTWKGGSLTEEQRAEIRAAFEESHRGASNAGRMMILGGDYDFKILGISQSQAQLLESRRFSREEIGAVFGYPVELMNDREHTGLSQAGLEPALRLMYQMCVLPYCKQFLSLWNPELVTPYRRDYVADFDSDLVSVLMVYDLEAKSRIHERLVRNGVPPSASIKLLDLNVGPITGGNTAYIVGGAPLAIGELDEDGAGESAEAALKIQKAPTARWKEVYELLGPIRQRWREKLRRRLLLALRRAVRCGETTEEYEDELLKSAVKATAEAIRLGQGVNGLEPISADTIRFESRLLQEAAVGLVSRAIEIVRLWALGTASEVAAEMPSPERLARFLSRTHLIWAYNAGVYFGRDGRKRRLAPPEGCAAEHEGEYPGDHRLKLDQLGGCECILVWEARNAGEGTESVREVS